MRYLCVYLQPWGGRGDWRKHLKRSIARSYTNSNSLFFSATQKET